MPAPTDIKTLRSFLGLVSHYSSFLPELHRIRSPLNHLLKKEITWNWSPECKASFAKIKASLSSDLLLTHLNQSLDIVVVSDASDYDAGAVISHIFPDSSSKAIAHASRSLTSAERNYGQIEEEALTIIYAIKRSHKMVYGRHFTLVTDHKPLISIFGSKKGIPMYTANRLQRWTTTLLDYDFSIKYLSTNSIGHADALSRLINTHQKQPEDSVVAAISSEPNISSMLTATVRELPVTSHMIKKATASDPLLQEVICYHCTGWPTVSPNKQLLPFFQQKSSLFEVDGVLLFAERVIIPSSLQNRSLKKFHFGHQGVCPMKALARGYVYWPNMDKQLEDLARTCAKCQLAAKSPRKYTLSSWPVPDSPWSRLHIDFSGPKNRQSFLVDVDAFKKWPEIFLMSHITSEETISKFQKIFLQIWPPGDLVLWQWHCI